MKFKTSPPLEIREIKYEKIFITLPPELSKAVGHYALDHGYGQNVFSKCVEDIALEFVQQPEAPMVILSVALNRMPKYDRKLFQMEYRTKELLWQTMIKAAISGSEENPPILIETTYSLAVRSAIVWKMAKEKYMK